MPILPKMTFGTNLEPRRYRRNGRRERLEKIPPMKHASCDNADQGGSEQQHQPSQSQNSDQQHREGDADAGGEKSGTISPFHCRIALVGTRGWRRSGSAYRNLFPQRPIGRADGAKRACG